jgi:two-component system sensor histidine kinase HydH
MKLLRLRMRDSKLLSGVPAWLLIGSVAVLLPLFAFVTARDVNREKQFTTRLLLEKGAALIRSFEAGTRTGMMGMNRGGFQLQRLLDETAKQPDIAYLMVTDAEGRVIAHDDSDRVGSAYGTDLDLAAVSSSKTLRWRIVRQAGGQTVFEVYRKFEPLRPPIGMRHGFMRQMPPEGFDSGAPPQVIFVGLDMTSIEDARRSDVLHAVMMGATLLLIGFAGIAVLLAAQNHRTTRAALTRIKAFSNHVVQNIPIGLVATDDRQHIAAFNREAESILQLRFDDVAGRPAAAVLPAALWARLESGSNAGMNLGEEIECRLADGRQVPLEIGAGRLADEGGRFLGGVLLLRDLSEIRALRDEIARNQRLATVGRLAAGVAHEIRNPLSSIKGFATYFKERYRDNREDAGTAAIMVQEVDRLNRVVSQLLEFSRPVGILPRPVDVTRLIGDSLKLIAGQAETRGIALKADLPPKALDAVIDGDRLSQVMLNLYLNAVEAMAPGGELRVGLSASPDGGSLIVRVSDTGRGIPAEALPQIFEPYFTTKPSGTGLGLAIAHNIVQAMGGAITVESRLGHGTTFTLRIPAAPPRRAAGPERTTPAC